MTQRKCRDLIGKPVVGSNGRLFGSIADFDIDTDHWKVASIMLKVDSRAVTDLGLSKPLWRSAHVEVPASLIGAAQDVVLLKVSLEEFAEKLKAAVPEEGGESASPRNGKES